MSHSCDGTYEVYDERRRRARVEHRCHACKEPIRVGDLYCVTFIVFEGVESVKRCLRCQAIHEHLRDKSPDLWPDERLNCGEEYRQHWGEEPPAEIAALAFVTADEMQRRAAP